MKLNDEIRKYTKKKGKKVSLKKTLLVKKKQFENTPKNRNQILISGKYYIPNETSIKINELI